ncbi:hypothetical protein E4U38_004032 [Claviceps purpurea]|nr:hypothetical protein E4U38_004032 [Claviceps purpurea]
MSTFNGLVSEFPDIRIDFFRRHPDRTPPLACFLSHVHSDHLAGLESLRSPFVYCSPATKEILLRLEKYACRIDYARGVLEARQQTYKHLRRVLKALPMETPTTMELKPGYKIQVTLFDANHCPGSTMFLIEGQGKAILYTGDVRAEPWFVNSIARNPTIVEYTHGLRTLDKLYLDTSIIDDTPFQTKSEGIAELLQQVKKYPPDTIFHFQAWTFGYEEVWVALSKALKSRVRLSRLPLGYVRVADLKKIHVDAYKFKIFQSLNSRSTDTPFSADCHLTIGAAALNGHMCGNSQHPGCLTLDQDVRIHSCEKANMCSVAKQPEVVSIRPVVFRQPNGHSIMEVGVGGGGKDFSREAELDWIANNDIDEFLQSLPDHTSMDNGMKEEVRAALQAEVASGRQFSLKMTIDEFDDQLSAGASIQSLFGPFCSGQIFEHDQVMAAIPTNHDIPPTQERSTPEPGSQESYASRRTPVADPAVPVSTLHADQNRHDRSMMEPSVHADIPPTKKAMLGHVAIPHARDESFCIVNQCEFVPQERANGVPALSSMNRPCAVPHDDNDDKDSESSAAHVEGEQVSQKTTITSTDSVTSPDQSLSRYEAYQAMLSNSAGTGSWMPISLLSTDANHGVTDTEL